MLLFTAVGDTVTEDEVVCEIETDKVNPVWHNYYLLGVGIFWNTLNCIDS